MGMMILPLLEHGPMEKWKTGLALARLPRTKVPIAVTIVKEIINLLIHLESGPRDQTSIEEVRSHSVLRGRRRLKLGRGELVWLLRDIHLPRWSWDRQSRNEMRQVDLSRSLESRVLTL
jgi:hypothetical protein